MIPEAIGAAGGFTYGMIESGGNVDQGLHRATQGVMIAGLAYWSGREGLAMNPFVKKLSAQRSNRAKRVVIEKPKWQDVEIALGEIAEGQVIFIELSDSTDLIVMTVFGNGEMFHLSTNNAEVEESWIHNGEPINEIRTDIGNYSFPSHQICSDRELVNQIVKCFFETGKHDNGIAWITNSL